MGEVIKLHRRLVKKRNEIKTHKQAVGVLLQVVATYAKPEHWRDTEETRDIMEKGIVVGVEILRRWIGPGNGPGLAQQIMKGVTK
jgi:hypothetical protein